MSPAISCAAPSCEVSFGGGAAIIADGDAVPKLRVALDALGGDDRESLLTATRVTPVEGGRLFSGSELTAGFALARDGLPLEPATTELYGRLFAVTAGLHLYRLWNYVPHINAGDDGLENYRRFCRARAEAFELRYGRDFHALLPSSSAVGAAGGPLALAFIAGPAPGRHFENPLQLPAFQYPPEHGPRPPSFSRATVVQTGTAVHAFISGTAAIRGHTTVAPGDWAGQLECTLENLAAIGATAGVGRTLGADGGWRRQFKVYLRHRGDLPRAVARLNACLLQPTDRVAYLRADICRAELLLEIEATLTRAV